MTEFANTDTVTVADDEIIVSVVEGYVVISCGQTLKVLNTDCIFIALKVSIATIVVSSIFPTAPMRR